MAIPLLSPFTLLHFGISLMELAGVFLKQLRGVLDNVMQHECQRTGAIQRFLMRSYRPIRGGNHPTGV